MSRRYPKNQKTEKRRRANRVVALRLENDLRAQRFRSEAVQRIVGTTGLRTVKVPEFTNALLAAGRRIVDASVGACALVGENLGEQVWRHKRCYLGLFYHKREGS